MNKERIKKRIGELMVERNRFIEQRNHWEANKLGEKIAGLRHQLTLSDLAIATENMNARFTREHDVERPTTQKVRI